MCSEKRFLFDVVERTKLHSSKSEANWQRGQRAVSQSQFSIQKGNCYDDVLLLVL